MTNQPAPSDTPRVDAFIIQAKQDHGDMWASQVPKIARLLELEIARLSAEREKEPRVEQCCECNVYVSEWVEAETTNNIQTVELIRGQRLASINRITSAYDWIEKQDLHDVKCFQISTNDDFKGKIKISVHLTFESHEKARYWAAKNLRDARKADGVFSSIMSYYSQEFPDFIALAHFPIDNKFEQNPSKGV